MQRHGFIEETYFSWSIIPLIGPEGSVVGLYNPAFEKTRRKIAERRMLTLREIGEKTASAREVSQFWGLLIEGLQFNEFDAPLVLVYSLADDGSSDDGASVSSAALNQSKQCVLEGSLGVPAGHPAVPERIDLKSGKEGFVSAFRLAMTSDKPIVLSEEDGTLDTNMLEGIQWRGWGDPSRTVVICPVRPTTGESTLGFLVMATNPRRPYDEDYGLFVQLLGRQLATSIASVVLFEEEIRRGEQAAKLAAQDRIELSTQLAARTQEAAESETKFTRMAELVPVGMFMADSQGQITYCNDTWYDIAQHPRGEAIGNKWVGAIHPEDLPTVEKNWNAMLEDLVPISVQFRFKHPWRDKTGNTGYTWVLANSYPEKGPDGKLKSIFGSVTDISSQKFAEDLQKRRMEEAMELKRQQENFIDITSHEMRNPLSAILQCADEISTTLSELRTTGSLSEEQAAVVDSNIDAAQTVTLCAQHQRRIVDDVLTLSKLDSAMLLVTPVDVQPATVVQRALKMFEGELQNADIVLEFKIHESFHALRIDWVRLDPSRLLQILINLTTNVRSAAGQTCGFSTD
jgi:PAS domain S-box-containing protein